MAVLIAELGERSVLKSVEGADELDLIDAALVSLLDGEAELGSVARRLGLPIDEAIAIAAKLLNRGVVALDRPAGSGLDVPRVERKEAREEEESELDPLRAALVESTYAQLKRASLYELLEISPDADAREVRSAYFRLSKLFHPDTLYGKRLGRHRVQMEAIFREMTSAYQVLSRKSRRDEYNARLGSERLNMLRAKIPLGVGAPEAREERSAAPRRQLDTDARRRLARQRLSGGLRSALAASTTSSPRERTKASTPGSGARAAADALLRSLDAQSSKPNPVDVLIKRAHRAEEEGRFEEALNQWLALERMQPDLPGLDQKLDDLRAIIARANLPEYRSLAAAHLRAGRMREAALVYERICAGAPGDIEAHLTAASICRKLEPPDLRAARDYAKRAEALDPSRLSIQLLLVRIYMDAGMRHNATRLLHELLLEHPKDPETIALRQELLRKRGHG